MTWMPCLLACRTSTMPRQSPLARKSHDSRWSVPQESWVQFRPSGAQRHEPAMVRARGRSPGAPDGGRPDYAAGVQRGHARHAERDGRLRARGRTGRVRKGDGPVNAQAIPHSRVGYIGGANVAGILGISPFRTPLDEYLLITGEREEVVTPEKAEFLEDRRDLEPWAAKKFTRKTGLAVVRANQRYDDAMIPWAKSEIDFEVEDGGNGETKTVHPNAVRDWGDPDAGEEPPLYVTAQAMWGLGVQPATHCYVQALVGF